MDLWTTPSKVPVRHTAEVVITVLRASRSCDLMSITLSEREGIDKKSVKMLLGTLVLSVAASAADPFTGIWKINPEKSKTSSGRVPETATVTIKAISDGYRITSSLVPPPFTLHLNGKDYKDDTKGFAATLAADHSSARRIDSRTIETTFKRDGKAVGTLRRELSADGRTMTATFEGISPKGEKIHYIVVYEKQ